MDATTRTAIETARNAANGVSDEQVRTALLALVTAIETSGNEGVRVSQFGGY